MEVATPKEQSWHGTAWAPPPTYTPPCATTDPELWYPELGASTRSAKRICETCLVVADCLTAAIAQREPAGVWGGLDILERKPMWTNTKRRTNGNRKRENTTSA